MFSKGVVGLPVYVSRYRVGARGVGVSHCYDIHDFAVRFVSQNTVDARFLFARNSIPYLEIHCKELDVALREPWPGIRRYHILLL